MSQPLQPPLQSENSKDKKDENAIAPVPWYQRSFFWIIIGVLLGLCLAVLLTMCQPAKQNLEPKTVTIPEEFFEINRARIRGLEEELARLETLLEQDVCADPTLLATPGTSKPSPDYALPYTPNQETVPPQGSSSQKRTKNGRQKQQDTLPVSPELKKPAPTSAPTPATVSELMDQATVFVIMITDDSAGIGSGFFVAPGIIATNRHVVGSPSAKIMVGNKALGGMRPASIIAFSQEEKRDYALLRIRDEEAKKTPFLKLTNSDIKRTEKVSAWGFPAFITTVDPKFSALLEGDASNVPEVVYSEGVISVVLDNKPPYIIHTAAISQGNSGGPLINAEGVVVGINSMLRLAEKDSYSQSGVALPSSDIILFMQENGVAPAISKKEQE